MLDGPTQNMHFIFYTKANLLSLNNESGFIIIITLKFNLLV